MSPLPPLPPLPALDDKVSMQKYYVSGKSNWLVPGVVMMGQSPARDVNVGDLMATLRTGKKVTTFVCLQSEVPPQSDSTVLIGGIVEGDQVNSMPSYASAAIAADPAIEPKFVHYGIKDDETAQSVDDLFALCSDLTNRIYLGEVLYIHCKGGTGRTGTVAACLLGKLYAQLSAEDALERTQKYVETRMSGQGKWVNPKIKSPATDGQKQQVREFFAFSPEPDDLSTKSTSTREESNFTEEPRRWGLFCGF